MGFDRRGKKCWFAPASARLQSPGAAAQSLEARASACRGRGRGRRTKRVGACRARPTGGRREGAEGVWQWFLANTKDPLATHFPSAPLSPPQINTLVVFIPGCLVSLSVGVTVCSEGQTRRDVQSLLLGPAPALGWAGRARGTQAVASGQRRRRQQRPHAGARRGSPSEVDSAARVRRPAVAVAPELGVSRAHVVDPGRAGGSC